MSAGDPWPVFELPEDLAAWDDRAYFAFLQEHQFAYQGMLDDLKARGQQDSDEFRHYLQQFQAVERCLARDFNRRYHQG
ncbi:MAG: hypothetical protein KGS61_02320 [Verrucomicrobia bacterium]|nr:hypothetical protein [Verrucomicrobiota bacterium]